jgi:hypothetical protein
MPISMTVRLIEDLEENSAECMIKAEQRKHAYPKRDCDYVRMSN